MAPRVRPSSSRSLLGPTLVCALGVLAPALLVACRERPQITPAITTTSAEPHAASAGAPGSSAATARSAPPATSAAPLTAAQKQSITAALRRGQSHVGAKRWAEAAQAYEEALRVAPTDGAVLCELGFVAWRAGDYDKAEAANLRALSFVHEPNLRAKVLFNQGLVHESKGQKPAAAQRFAESLALRKNDTVEKHLREIDKDKVVKADAREPVPCAREFPNVNALCGCLKAEAEKDRGPSGSDEPLVCATEKAKSPSGDLFSIKIGREMMGERDHIAVAKTEKGVFPIGMLGRDFEPGAFGVHNEATVTSVEETTIDGRKVWLVRSSQSNFDQNMAGLEQYQDTIKLLTFCLPQTADKPPSCPVQYATDIHATLSYPDFDEMSAEDRAEQKERRKGAYDRRTLLAHDVSGGVVNVKLTKGSAKDLSPGVIGPHKLF